MPRPQSFIFKLFLFMLFLFSIDSFAFYRSRISGSGVKTFWYEQALPIAWVFSNDVLFEGLTSTESGNSLVAAHDAWSVSTITGTKLSFNRIADAAVYYTALLDQNGIADPNLGVNSHHAIASNWPFGSGTIAVTLSFYRSKTGGIATSTDDLLDGSIIDADILYNDQDFDYCVEGVTDCGTPRSRIDLTTVATHELGHQIGLAHQSQDENAIMYPAVSIDEVKDVTDDEIAAVRCMYHDGIDPEVKRTACLMENNAGAASSTGTYLWGKDDGDRTGSCLGVVDISKDGPGGQGFFFTLFFCLLCYCALRWPIPTRWLKAVSY